MDNTVYYRINNRNLEWNTMVYSNATNLAQIFANQVRLALGNHILQVILFGSRARQEHTEYSDYDIAMIVNQHSDDIHEKILDIEIDMLNHHDTLFSTILYDVQEWELEKKSPLGWNIQDDGIVL